MCGIVGYIGKKNTKEILISGLKKLEYRGYDSAGLALISDGGLVIEKEEGKVSKLQELVSKYKENEFKTGIAHTRWATHGEPSKLNAHPHTNQNKDIAIVHNGIIENYASLKKYLIKKGHKFSSETDTEIFAHLIEENYSGDILEAVRMSLKEVSGSYAFAVVHKDHKNKIIAAKKGSPLIIGVGKNEMYLASDVSAIVKYTKDIIYVDEEEIVELENDKYNFYSFDKSRITKKMEKAMIDIAEIEKNGYDHYMLKEIYEQPKTILNAIRGRIDLDEATPRLDGLDQNVDYIKKALRAIFVGCGTSWHAGIIGSYYMEKFAKIPTTCEYASELRYRDPVVDDKLLSFYISQSGETADSLAALKELKRKSATCLGIVNTVNSAIARETHGGVYLHAGTEIGVASTKAFTSQVTVTFLVSLLIGRLNNLSYEDSYKYLKELKNLPNKVEDALKVAKQVEKIAKKFKDAKNALFLGRGINYPVALEGALKLKEISYVHAEGYPAAEMKHGPIALIDENMPVIVIATKDPLYEKTLANIQEVKARKGKVIVIANEGDEKIKEFADYIIRVPETLPMLSPLINVIPLQLFSYYSALVRGCNVDQPRNLAKSVTVE